MRKEMILMSGINKVGAFIEKSINTNIQLSDNLGKTWETIKHTRSVVSNLIDRLGVEKIIQTPLDLLTNHISIDSVQKQMNTTSILIERIHSSNLKNLPQNLPIEEIPYIAIGGLLGYVARESHDKFLNYLFKNGSRSSKRTAGRILKWMDKPISFPSVALGLPALAFGAEYINNIVTGDTEMGKHLRYGLLSFWITAQLKCVLNGKKPDDD